MVSVGLWSVVLSLVLLTLPWIGAASVAGHPVATAAAVAELTSDEQDALAFREEMGLEHDVETVRAAERDPVRYPERDFLVPLTHDENEELLRRVATQHALGSLVDDLREDDSFAGAYIDQQRDGLAVLQFTTDPSPHAQRIQEALPAESDFVLQQVTRSEAQLLEVQADIDASWPDLSAEGISVIATGIDDRQNSVVVDDRDPSTRDVHRLHELYGDAVTVRSDTPSVADACNSVHDCRPMKGGLEIISQYDNGECTSGYMIKRTDTGSAYLLTAGHCLHVHGGYDKKWEHNPALDPSVAAFGWSRRDTWDPGTNRNADVGLTTVSSNELGNRNEIYVGGGAIRKVVNWADAAEQVVGGVALMFGQAGGDESGTILLRNVSRPSEVAGWGSMNVLKSVEVSFNPISGDSGGPVFYPAPSGGLNVIALGTHVHSDPGDSNANGDGWYSPFDTGRDTYSAMWGYSYTLCITTGCT
jgi:hypothetical protein